MRQIIIFSVFFITFSYGFLYAQETPPNPEDIAAINDEFENNFYNALTQKAIENNDKAIAYLQKCIHQEPDNPVLFHELGKNYLALKNYAEAQSWFQKAIDANPKERWYWNGLYDVFYATKDYPNAIKIVQKLLEFDTNFQDDLVSLYMQTNQKEKALQLLQNMEQTTNLSQTMEYYKLLLQKNNVSKNNSIENLEIAIKNNPLIEQNYIDLIYQYSEENNEEKAFTTAKKLAENIPNSDWAYVSLTKFYLDNKDGEKATEAMFKVLNSNKIDIKIKHRVLNEFLIFSTANAVFSKELEQAVAILDKEANINVSEEVAKYFWKKSNIERAIFYFEKSIQKGDENFESIDFLLQLYLQNKDYGKMEKLTNTKLELFPTQASLYYFSGVALLQLSKTKEAIEKLEEGLDYVVENAALENNFYQQLALCYEKLGNTSKAENYLKKVKK